MYVRSELKPSIILWFCWRHVVFFIAYSAVVYYLFHQLDCKWVGIPFLPVGTIGTAVAFYVGFKNNASYERLWEGRKIWGSIANLSRAIAGLAGTASADGDGIKSDIVKRQIAWCNLLRLQLRGAAAGRNSHKTAPEVGLIRKLYGTAYDTETAGLYMERNLPGAELARVQNTNNPAYKLLELQMKDVAQLVATGAISREISEKLSECLIECFKEQGASERIKSFPFPRQYAYFSGIFVWIFLLLLPCGLVEELAKAPSGLDWMVVPFATLISWMFITMEQVGDSSEDPFEMGLNDVPLTAICRGIEIDLLQSIGADRVPEPVRPIADILL